MRHQAKKNLLHRLEADAYTIDEVTVLTIPLSLPYPVQQGEYEHTQGEFEHKGEYFRLIKQKLSNDTLYLVCVKDVHGKKIASTLVRYASLANDLPTSSKHTLHVLGKFFKDFQVVTTITVVRHPGWCRSALCPAPCAYVLANEYPVIAPPPKA